ncbi:MAG: response regulator [Clostridia bacterium]|nr:response regulator [Clostridia bacterium]
MSKVLIVDDSFLARKLLRKMLEKLNHEIVGEAENGEKALLLYKTTQPDIVMMDLVMPGIGGIEAAKLILGTNPDAKIIINSSHVQNNLKSELIHQGLKYLITKPIDEIKLDNAIRKILAGMESNISLDDSAEKKLRTEVRSFLHNIAKDVQEKGKHEENGLNVGDKVSLSHYVSEQPMTASIVERKFNELILKLDKKIDTYSFSIEEPLTLCFMWDGSVRICEAGISEIVAKENCIRVIQGKTSLLHDETLEESFPCSISVDFKLEYSNKKQFAVIKNIGPYSMRIVSKAELETGSIINFNIFLEEKVVTLNAEIVSRSHGVNCFEYEVKTTFIDLNSKKLLKLYIYKLKDNHERAVQRLVGEK